MPFVKDFWDQFLVTDRNSAPRRWWRKWTLSLANRKDICSLPVTWCSYVMVKGWVNLMGMIFRSHRWMAFEMQQYKVLDSLTQDGPARIRCDEQTGKSQSPKSLCQFCFFLVTNQNKLCSLPQRKWELLKWNFSLPYGIQLPVRARQ